MAFGWEGAFRRDRGGVQRWYTRLFGAVDLPTRIRARAIMEILRGAVCDSALDVGAGTGAYAFYLTRIAASLVMAFDIDARRVENIRDIAQRLNRHTLSTLCGGQPIVATLPSSCFGVVLAIEVLQYLPGVSEYLGGLHRALRRGGILIAHVPIRLKLQPYELYLFDDTRLRELFAEAGFEQVEIRQTFGRAERMLCAVFSWCVAHPLLLAALYPLLLAAIALRPRFTDSGNCRVVIARKAVDRGQPGPGIARATAARPLSPGTGSC
ncbi:MAG: class I SAM-dependent methyltransferase [Pseudolabrys sp.]